MRIVVSLASLMLFIASARSAINDMPASWDQTINEDTPTVALPFLVGDAETPAASLALRAASSNPALVPVSNIIFGGTSANRTVIITPTPNQSGSTTITVSVS